MVIWRIPILPRKTKKFVLFNFASWHIYQWSDTMLTGWKASTVNNSKWARFFYALCLYLLHNSTMLVVCLFLNMVLRMREVNIAYRVPNKAYTHFWEISTIPIHGTYIQNDRKVMWQFAIYFCEMFLYASNFLKMKEIPYTNLIYKFYLSDIKLYVCIAKLLFWGMRFARLTVDFLESIRISF